MKHLNSIFKTVSMITIFTVLTRFLGFIFRIFLSRKLGAEGLGIYQIASSIIGVFMVLVASGLPLTTAKFVAKSDSLKNYAEKHSTTTTASIIALIISFASCAILLLGQNILGVFVKNQTIIEIILIMCPALIFSSVYAIFRGALWGQNSFFWVSFTEFLEQVIRMILSFIVLGKLTNVIDCTKALAYTFTLTCLISSIFVIIIYFVNGGRIKFNRNNYKNIIKSSAPITGVRLASSFIQPLTALLIPFLLTIIGFSSEKAISTYGMIMGMSFPLLFAPLSVIGSLSMVLIPKISVLNSQNDNSAIQRNVDKSLNFSMFLAALFIPLYLSCGDLIGIVLYDNLQAGIYLQLSSVCILPIILNNITSSILNALNLEVKSFINYIIGTVVMLISLCSLVFVVKETAIIYSMFLSTMTTALLNLKMLNKHLNRDSNKIILKLLSYSLIILPCSLIGHLISNALYHILPAIIAGFIGGSISIVSTYLLINTFKVYNFHFKKLKNQ